MGICGFLVTFGFWVLRRLRNAVFLFLFNLEYFVFVVSCDNWVLGVGGLWNAGFDDREKKQKMIVLWRVYY